MKTNSFDDELNSQLMRMQKTKQPEKDLWQGVELALINEQDSEAKPSTKIKYKRKVHLIAATVAMFGLTSWLLFEWRSVLLMDNDVVTALTEQHLAQKNGLLVRFKNQPALTQNWQSQLSELDDAAKAIKNALRDEPNNMALLKMLQSVYQQQISLIERVHSSKWSKI
jgi:hypothetical protein